MYVRQVQVHRIYVQYYRRDQSSKYEQCTMCKNVYNVQKFIKILSFGQWNFALVVQFNACARDF